MNALVRLSEASGVPFYKQIVDQLAEQIRSGALPAGSPLPSVRELSASLLVSLITTRRAYSDLENLGLVVLRQGQGTFVALDVALRAEAQTLSELRDALKELVHRARGAGVGDDPIRQALETVLADRGSEAP